MRALNHGFTLIERLLYVKILKYFMVYLCTIAENRDKTFLLSTARKQIQVLIHNISRNHPYMEICLYRNQLAWEAACIGSRLHKKQPVSEASCTTVRIPAFLIPLFPSVSFALLSLFRPEKLRFYCSATGFSFRSLPTDHSLPTDEIEPLQVPGVLRARGSQINSRRSDMRMPQHIRQLRNISAHPVKSPRKQVA